MAVIAPLVFMWTGVAPLVHVTTAAVLYYLVPMVLAVVGGIWVYAPQQYFPLAAQVLGTFQSFKLLPTVLATLAQPFGHVFKVTPKGRSAEKAGYDRGIFWTAILLMGLTVAGLFINTVPDWRIVTQTSLLPMVAFWAAINVVVLFLISMLSLQAPFRRAEERFALDEPIWIVGTAGTLVTGRVKDISLSGAGIVTQRSIDAKLGERLRVFIAEVGFVSGTLVRSTETLVGIQFDLPASIERDLLIRKLFTAGRDTTHVAASAWSATGAMLKSIFEARAEMPAVVSESAQENAPLVHAAAQPEKLPAQSLVVLPKPSSVRLSDLVEARRAMAA
jgi:cellulose synthase (UDP-forming)